MVAVAFHPPRPQVRERPIDRREVCVLHGWVGLHDFQRDRHDLCEVPIAIEPRDLENDDDDDAEPELTPFHYVDDGDGRKPRRRRDPKVSRPSTLSNRRASSKQDAAETQLVVARPLVRGDCEWCPICQEQRDVHAERDQSNGTTIRKTHSDHADGGTKTRIGNVGSEVRLREGASTDQDRRPDVDEHDELRMQSYKTRPHAALVAYRSLMAGNASAMHESEGEIIQGLRKNWNSGLRTMEEIRQLPGGHGRTSTTNDDRSVSKPNGKLRARELPLGDGKGTTPEPGQQSPGDRRRSHGNGGGVERAVGTELHDHSRATGTRVERLSCGHRADEYIFHSRPCLFVACRHSLYLEVNQSNGSIKLNFPDLEPGELTESCALDVTLLGGITLDAVGNLMNLSRERIRQLEAPALKKLKQKQKDLENPVDAPETVWPAH